MQFSCERQNDMSVSCSSKGAHFTMMRFPGYNRQLCQKRYSGKTHGPKHNVLILTRAGGGIDGWFDLASFVATSSSSKSPFEELADSIGKDCYVDIAGWHLFLKDIKVEGQTTMAQVLAAKLGGDMMYSGFDDRDVEDAIKKVPVKIGQGKVTVSLKDAMPAMVVSDLMDICKEYARRNC